MSKISKILAVSASLAVLMPAVAFAQSKNAAKAHTWNGSVTSVSGASIMLAAKNGTAYTVDATNAKLIRKFGAAISLSDIQNGDQLQVRGTVASTTPAVITATSVRDMSLQARNGMFTGTVQSVGSASFTLQSRARGTQTINFDGATVFKKNNQSATAADLASGQIVAVSGVWDRTSSNVAAKTVRIIIKTSRVSFSGTLSGISGGTLTVAANNGTTYAVDAASAKIYNKANKKIGLADLAQSDNVMVTGTSQASSTSVTATKVRDLSK